MLKLRALEALRYREFRLLWYGQVFTSMATWMDSIARGWPAYGLVAGISSQSKFSAYFHQNQL